MIPNCLRTKGIPSMTLDNEFAIALVDSLISLLPQTSLSLQGLFEMGCNKLTIEKRRWRAL